MSMTETAPVHVLSVEDNPGDARLIGELLAESDLPFVLETVERLATGLARLEEGGIDVVLLDLSLPDSSGLETLKAIRAQDLDVPIVVLTGHGDEPELGLQAVRKGAEDYLVKGELVPSHLARSLTHAIERRSIQRKLDESRAQLQQQAFLDPLTQLLNRRGLERALRDLYRSGNGGEAAVALLLDLDEFKRINDTHGHSVGDRVLQAVSELIRSNVRPADPVARIGGDEFLVFFPSTSPGEASRVAERMRLAMGESPIQLAGGGTLHITASMGLATFSGPVYSLALLVSKTEHALHRSKATGKYRITILAAEESAELDDEPPHLDLLVSLPRGRDLRVFRQGVHRLGDERVVGYELLTRGPPGTYEAPIDLFRLCSEHDMRAVVDLRALELAVAAAREQPGPPGLRYHFNLFPSTLLEVGVERVLELLGESHAPGGCCIELSERYIEGDAEELVGSVRQLKRAGYLLALDDVGFGRSSFESLIRLEPDFIKVDPTWSRGLGSSGERTPVLRRLHEVARALGAELIAEGVESRRELELLQELEVEQGQGYYWGEPVEG